MQKIFSIQKSIMSSQEITRLYQDAIVHDNLEAFLALYAEYPNYRRACIIQSAKAFASRIFSWLLVDVSPPIPLHDLASDLAGHLTYGYLASYALGYLTPRGQYSDHHNREEIKAKNEPIYYRLLSQLKPRIEMSRARLAIFLNDARFRSMETIRNKNRQLRAKSVF